MHTPIWYSQYGTLRCLFHKNGIAYKQPKIFIKQNKLIDFKNYVYRNKIIICYETEITCPILINALTHYMNDYPAFRIQNIVGQIVGLAVVSEKRNGNTI